MKEGRQGLALKILYDDEALSGFKEKFGFSCWIKDKGVLFDTGGDLTTLLFNMKRFTIDPKTLIK